MKNEYTDWKSVREILLQGRLLDACDNKINAINILHKRLRDRKARKMMGGCQKPHKIDEYGKSTRI